MTDYELRVTTGGYISKTLSEIIDQVAPAVGLYPGHTFQSANVEGNIIHIYYSDDSATPKAEAVPLIVYAILAAITVLGIAYVTYEIFVVAPKSPFGQLTIIAGVLTAIALLINSLKKE